ncbi:MAG: SNF2-related protein [Candidatus Bipolaricaulis sp.]|nr:SNF2-related protein [Candidatus Bipolaricaulis sp.]
MASSKGDETKKARAGALTLGTKVLVYGKAGEIQKAQQVGDGRWRYSILFDDGQVRTYTSPPTTIEPVRGPADRLVAGEFAPEIEFDLLGEALRLSTAYEHERLVSLSSSRINMEPYQVFAVHEVISRFPHRFLIADDTGLGKTIEAGMILEELTARGRADRVLIVTPAALAIQWKEELKRAFNRDFVFATGATSASSWRSFPPSTILGTGNHGSSPNSTSPSGTRSEPSWNERGGISSSSTKLIS